MPRPMSEPTLTWKVHIPASLVGRIEFMLTDPITHKPIYGARTELVIRLLQYWEAKQMGAEGPQVPSLKELRTKT